MADKNPDYIEDYWLGYHDGRLDAIKEMFGALYQCQPDTTSVSMRRYMKRLRELMQDEASVRAKYLKDFRASKGYIKEKRGEK